MSEEITQSSIGNIFMKEMRGKYWITDNLEGTVIWLRSSKEFYDAFMIELGPGPTTPDKESGDEGTTG